jgi:hypothetical protein
MGRPHRDERGIIVNWIVRIVVTTAVVGIVLFDAGSVAVNFFGLDATADDVAVSVSNFVKNGSGTVTVGVMEEEARKLAREHDARLTEFSYDQTDGVVTVTLKREANTLIISRIGATEDWGKATAESQASTR